MQRAPDCSTWTLTTIRLATLKPDSVTHIWPDFLSHLVSTEIWRFSEDPVSAQTLSGSWLSLSCPSLSPSLRVAVLLASHHWPHLPLLLQPARPRQPLRSRLTTPYFLTAVVLRPSSFPPLLIQSHTFPTRPSSFLRFTIYTDDSLLRWHILILSVILVFNLVKCSQHHALDTVISTDCNSFINWIPKHPWHSSSPPSAVSTSKFWSHWDLK